MQISAEIYRKVHLSAEIAERDTLSVEILNFCREVHLLQKSKISTNFCRNCREGYTFCRNLKFLQRGAPFAEICRRLLRNFSAFTSKELDVSSFCQINSTFFEICSKNVELI
jgi:hypothetical protein